MAGKTGYECKLYVRTSGTYAAPTWTEAKNIADAAIGGEKAKAEFRTRGQKVKTSKGVDIDMPVTGRIKYDPANAIYLLFLDSFWNGTVLDVMVLDGDEDDEDTVGWRGDYEVMTFPHNQAMDEGVYIDFEMSPAEGGDQQTAGLEAVEPIGVLS